MKGNRKNHPAEFTLLHSLLFSVSLSPVSCKFPTVCWHSFISDHVSETYLCLAGLVTMSFSPSASHPSIIGCWFITLSLPWMDVWYIASALITAPCREITWASDVASAVTNIQLEELAALLVKRSISTRLMEHVWCDTSASGTRIYQIIRNETDSHPDNYLPQQEICASARAYPKLSV